MATCNLPAQTTGIGLPRPPTRRCRSAPSWRWWDSKFVRRSWFPVRPATLRSVARPAINLLTRERYESPGEFRTGRGIFVLEVHEDLAGVRLRELCPFQ